MDVRARASRPGEGPWVLALDVGTSSVRAGVYGATGRVVPSTATQLGYAWRTTPDGGMEVSPAELLDLTCRATDAALAAARAARLEIAAVSTACFWHSLMGLGHAGAPLTPLYSWGDTRAAAAAAWLRERLDERAVHRRTGCFFHSSYPAAKLVWLRSAAADTFPSIAHWLSFGEYLALALFGERRCSYSMASGTGLFDIGALGWDPEMLTACGVRAAQLSALVDTDAPFTGLAGEYAARWPELAQVPWLPAVGDGACANVGSGAVGPGRMALTIGTSAALRVVHADEADPKAPVAVPLPLWCYRLDARRRVSGGALSNGGIVAAFLGELLRLPDADAWGTALAAREVASHGLVVLPTLLGERSPGGHARAPAAVVGATADTDALDVLHASLEAVAYNVAGVYDTLIGVFPGARELLASGGALYASPVWTQIVADAIGEPLALVAEKETTSRGAALVALERLGAIGALEDVPPPEATECRPDAARHARHVRAAARQRELESLLAPWWARAAEAARTS